MGTSGKEKKGTNACGGWEQGGGVVRPCLQNLHVQSIQFAFRLCSEAFP